LDSDHLFFSLILDSPAAGRSWVWKSFLRGHNPILMENLFEDSTGRAVPATIGDAGFVAARAAMGQTRRYAEKMNLVAMTPRDALSSTRYALADPASEYLVHQPHCRSFNVKLSPGTYSYEWFDADIGNIVANGVVVMEKAGMQREGLLRRRRIKMKVRSPLRSSVMRCFI
jgi:hypothetical protein